MVPQTTRCDIDSCIIDTNLWMSIILPFCDSRMQKAWQSFMGVLKTAVPFILFSFGDHSFLAQEFLTLNLLQNNCPLVRTHYISYSKNQQELSLNKNLSPSWYNSVQVIFPSFTSKTPYSTIHRQQRPSRCHPMSSALQDSPPCHGVESHTPSYSKEYFALMEKPWGLLLTQCFPCSQHEQQCNNIYFIIRVLKNYIHSRIVISSSSAKSWD